MTMVLRDEALVPRILEMSKLIRTVLSLPISTSVCERGFSAQNVIKTIKRNRVNDEALEGLHRYKWPPPEKMDHSAAVKGWLMKNKRTDDKAVKPMKTSKSDEGNELTEMLDDIPVDMDAKRAILFAH